MPTIKDNPPWGPASKPLFRCKWGHFQSLGAFTKEAIEAYSGQEPCSDCLGEHPFGRPCKMVGVRQLMVKSRLKGDLDTGIVNHGKPHYYSGRHCDFFECIPYDEKMIWK